MIDSRLIGGAVLENPDKAKAASPITYVDPNTPPFLIVHGDRDPVVPVQQSQLLHTALNDVNVPVQLEILRGAKHGGTAFSSDTLRTKVLHFFDRTLKQ